MGDELESRGISTRKRRRASSWKVIAGHDGGHKSFLQDYALVVSLAWRVHAHEREEGFRRAWSMLKPGLSRMLLLTSSNTVRKSIARVLTVINQKQRQNLREFYKNSKCAYPALPLPQIKR